MNRISSHHENRRVAHVTLLQSCPIGIITKLNGCAKDAISRKILIDYIVIIPDRVAADYKNFDSIKILTVPSSGNKIKIRLKQMNELIRISGEYERLVVRYFGADIGIFLPNSVLARCVAEHHTMFIAEQKKGSYFRSILESFLGKWFLSKFYGHIAVTQQILEDVKSRSLKKLFSIEKVIPNPYLFSNSCRDGCFSKKNIYTGVVVASKFEDWHGLDIILKIFEDQSNFRIFVVGDAGLVGNTKYNNIVFMGRKNNIELVNIYNQCDFAINSFGLHRLGMVESSTLKVREYFNYGLPVFSPISDSALPNNFNYFFLSEEANALKILLDGLDGVLFSKIKEAAKEYMNVSSFNDNIIATLGVK